MIPLAAIGPIGWTIIATFALFTTGVSSVLFVLLWAAKGSPDVNGDPERDSGLSDLEIERNAAIERNRRIHQLRREYLQLDPPPRSSTIAHRPSSIFLARPRDTLADLFGCFTIAAIIYTLLCLL